MVFQFTLNPMHYTSKEVYEHISTQNNDPIVKWKTCTVSGSQFAIFQSDFDFLEKVSPVFGGKKYLIPLPTLCPEERQRRRQCRRNERKLYKRKCDASGEMIISMYRPDSDYVIYEVSQRRSDFWNAKDFAIDYRPWIDCLSTLQQLSRVVPKMHMSVASMWENASYNNQATSLSRCYLLSNSANCEDCYYGNTIWDSHDIYDSLVIHHCQSCYNCIDASNCHSCFHCVDVADCYDCIECDGCQNCQHCVGCYNLQHKSYCISNKQYTKEEYEKAKQQYLWKKDDWLIKPSSHQFHTTQSYGWYIQHSHDVTFCHDITKSKNCKYVSDGIEFSSCMDVDYFWMQLAMSYEWSIIGINGHKLLFCFDCWQDVSDLIYCMYCVKSSHCFGCVWMRNASYCIFNKQYTKERYEELVAILIEQMKERGQWWEFLPPSLSPFGYNETTAQEYYPLMPEQALSLWYKRQNKNYDPQIPANIETLNKETIKSFDIKNNDEILHKILICEESARPFRIIKQELDFYRRFDLPLPTMHPDIRHKKRLQQRAWRQLHVRNCDATGEKMISVYPPSSSYTIYSESAYQQSLFA